jgi:hypothetical protein
MGRLVEGEDRSQSTLLPERLDDYVTQENPVRVVDGSRRTDPVNWPGCEGTWLAGAAGA